MGAGLYVVRRQVRLFQADQKAHQLASEAFNSDRVAAWNYAEQVNAVQRSYHHFNARLDTPWSFERFWNDLSQETIADLQSVAEKAGSSIGEARQHVLHGTLSRLPNPFPEGGPSRLKYAGWTVLQLQGVGLIPSVLFFVMKKKK